MLKTETACTSPRSPIHLWALHENPLFEICMNCKRVRALETKIKSYPQLAKERFEEQYRALFEANPVRPLRDES